MSIEVKKAVVRINEQTLRVLLQAVDHRRDSEEINMTLIPNRDMSPEELLKEKYKRGIIRVASKDPNKSIEFEIALNEVYIGCEQIPNTYSLVEYK